MALDLGFRHEAFFYAGQTELLERAAAFVDDAVAAGEPILVVLGAGQIAELQRRVGSDAPGVSFADMGVVGRNPARIIPAWRRFVEEHAGSAPGLRGIGEPIWSGRGPDELVECRQHEALLNLAFGDPVPSPAADRPGFWLLCPYDTTTLDPAVLDEARATHPFVGSNGQAHPSERYRGVAVDELLGEPLPAPRSPAAEMVFGRALVRLRRFVADQASRIARGRLDRRTLMDIVLAVEELGANSVRYGGGGGRVRIWREHETLLCEVSDRGLITDPLVGRQQPTPRQLGGRGLWMVHQLCDLVQVRSSPTTGTVTRLHVHLR